MAVKQTAGRDALGEFASKFAELNDDVLFGQVWSREDKLSLRDRSIVTVVALLAQGLTDSSFQYHLQSAKNNGVTKAEIAEILTLRRFMPVGPRRGRRSAWQKKCGRRTMLPRMRRPHTKAGWFSPSVRPTMPLQSISLGRVTLRRSPRHRWAFTM